MELGDFLDRAARVLARAEAWLPPVPEPVDWAATPAARWRPHPAGGGHLEAITRPDPVRLSDLRGVDDAVERLVRNTEQFLAGAPANNALLWGARGTGKSSLIKGLLTAYRDRGLRLVEVDKADLVHLPAIVEGLAEAPFRFLVFCDDLSFDADERGYKALKVALDGSLAAPPANVLIHATSNRRHLMPEDMAENRQARMVDGEIHPAEATDEKIALSERFGLWVPFHPFSQEEYLAAVDHWLLHHGLTPDEATHEEALRFALERGSRSGRVAAQFARDRAGRAALPREDGTGPRP
ncbi:MAG: ATP-binding protein [Thiohalospira sp.]